MSIHKILVANRGEIALRIIRTAQALGYETVALFSQADADAPHVHMADQAILLGPAEVGQSYLHVARVLAAAQRSGADAIHPGYGFLSENPDFAQQVIDAGLTWIGPPPTAMRIMGNKTAAKVAIANTGVPSIPGYSGEDQSDGAFCVAAESIGYPVMVKAASGGGGRGMRLVTEADALPAALASAKSEALKAFGSDELLLEKAIVNPRHIEVQVFGDTQGHVIHLGERDCSIQRRYQKVVEEAPSPVVSSTLRAQIGQAAVEAAKAVGYYGAGTVEFLLDEAGQFYFIEMNTRLQVEHPVTEMITGLDLVEWQLLVAEGEPLPLTQADLHLHGHAIEVRLYAEDPQNQFLPSIGQVHHWQPPTGEGVRVDHGLRSGMEITPYYDAMVAKIITWGETRALARRRMRRALHQSAVLGVETNRRFLLETVDHPTFAKGEATTQFVEEIGRSDADGVDQPAAPYLEALGALLFYQRAHSVHSTKTNRSSNNRRDGAMLKDWQSRPTTYCFDSKDRSRTVTIVAMSQQQYGIQCGEAHFIISCLSQSANTLRFEWAGLQESLQYAFGPDDQLWIQHGLETISLTDRLLAPPENTDTTGSGQVVAPMPGAVLRVDVLAGDSVQMGQPLLVLEAMKMEHTITAPFDGTVVQILIEPGQQMKPKELMVVVKA